MKGTSRRSRHWPAAVLALLAAGPVFDLHAQALQRQPVASERPLAGRVVPTTDTALARAVRAQLQGFGVPGMVWALVYPESTQLGAAGVRDLATSLPMTAEARVQVGSIAKTLLATGVLQLATRGLVDLDAPIATYLPQLPIDNHWETTAPLRVRHLLDHTSGLGDAHLWQVFTLRGSADGKLSESIVRPGQRLRLQSPPGARFSYSNTGFLLLGMLIEQRTGERYEPWLDRELLAPLGMTHSTFQFVSQAGDTTMSMGHFEGGTRQASYAIPARPASQFATTAADMARLARFLMSNGRVEGRPLVDSVLLAAMGRPTTTAAAHAGLAQGYGLGLQTRERWGIRGVCHTGNLGTFRAILCLYPDHQRAYFASYNSDPESVPWDQADSLLARRLGVPFLPQPTPASPPENVRQWEGWYVIRPTRFEQFAYIDALTALSRVTFRGDSLVLTPLGGTARVLEPAGGFLWRQRGRHLPTHVLLAQDGQRSLADAQRTFDRVSTPRVWLRWLAASIGVLAFLGLLVRGVFTSIRAWRARRLIQEPLTGPTLAFAVLVMGGIGMFRQPFLAMGDPTPANMLLAIGAGALLVMTGVSFVMLLRLFRAHERGDRAGVGLDLVLVTAALQWLVALAFAGLIPLRLWR